ncbi:two-component system regulatory protein YycI [Mesobacillus harenae]|uniref:two-component system regulatory protein YycI n=1 Tax=Mesobacillus harenae TaxID=2213203 RepID=UPI001580CE91|nr:two-component system regulatory protein YycI [Mesobacillus harenae]
MDWSRIKSIFILTFFILNVYLAYQFFNVRDAAKYEYIKEASFEEKLKNDDIQYKDLPKEQEKTQYISVKPKQFLESELPEREGELQTLRNGGTLLEVIFENPIKLPSKFDPTQFSAYIKQNIENGDQYTFWEKNDVNRTITFYQQSEGRTFYQNIYGKLIFTFNEDGGIVSYQQTFLEVNEQLGEKQELLSALRAIETLYNRGLLEPKSEITKIELGYATIVQLSASQQVLAPTWRFVINGEENLYVHAFEGQVIQFGEEI